MLKVLEEVSVQSDSVDKACKVIQYAARVILVQLVERLQIQKTSEQLSLAGRLFILQKILSPSRKAIRLGRCFWYMPDIKKNGILPARDLFQLLSQLNTIIAMLNDLLDDVALFGSLGFLPKSVQSFAEVWAERVWFFTTWLDNVMTAKTLYDSHVAVGRALERNESVNKLVEKRWQNLILMIRFIADFIQAGSMALKLSTPKDVVAMCGVTSGGVSFYRIMKKAYEKHQK
jgi:hypothetical protein